MVAWYPGFRLSVDPEQPYRPAIDRPGFNLAALEILGHILLAQDQFAGEVKDLIVER